MGLSVISFSQPPPRPYEIRLPCFVEDRHRSRSATFIVKSKSSTIAGLFLCAFARSIGVTFKIYANCAALSYSGSDVDLAGYQSAR